MKYNIHFQYKGEGDSRPQDYSLYDEELTVTDGRTIPIPNVGDSVTFVSGGKPGAWKVITRHFGYYNDDCYINIVVTDLQEGELAARIIE